MDTPFIIVLDDEPGITLLCKRLLTRAGFDALTFTEPRKAMLELEKRRADLLLVDIRMPDIDGFGVIQHARREQPEIAVLVMTGFGTVETAIHALRQGVDGLVLKPFQEGGELVASVKQALADNRQKRDSARVQALRPLFAVTESLLSETDPIRLQDLILDALIGHLRCSSAGLYERNADGERVLLASRGIQPFDLSSSAEGWSAQSVELESPKVLSVSGPGEPATQSDLMRRGLSAAMFVPVSRPSVNSLFYAGRATGESPFVESDLEMLIILARQAAIAMENARLYAELRDTVRRVEESQQALVQSEKMAAAGRLTASIAHEINNPLQAVQNCIHLAGRQDVPAAKRQKYFELARTELDRLQITVQRMLDFYRPSQSALPRMVDVEELLAHVLGLMSKQLEERGVVTSWSILESVPQILAVDSQIQQVFINLILNAYDAMPEGGDLRITAGAAGEGVEILFQDAGAGVPVEKSKHIFEPFISTKEGGTGLGLTVSYNIVTAHGGTLDLVNGDGLGACFRVYLPSGGPN